MASSEGASLSGGPALIYREPARTDYLPRGHWHVAACNAGSARAVLSALRFGRSCQAHAAAIGGDRGAGEPLRCDAKARRLGRQACGASGCVRESRRARLLEAVRGGVASL